MDYSLMMVCCQLINSFPDVLTKIRNSYERSFFLNLLQGFLGGREDDLLAYHFGGWRHIVVRVVVLPNPKAVILLVDIAIERL